MDQIRFLDLETHTAAENMAIDEAIMLTMKEGSAPPTFRLYRWEPSAVSIGTFQGMEEEVDVEYCKKEGIDFVRRLTGGGAVYHDYFGEITYSLILPKGHRLVPDDIIKSYENICQGLVTALSFLGIESEFRPINDVVTGGKKISGNAQTRRHSCVLQHGTTLLDLDVDCMFSVLKVSEEKVSDKMIQDVKQRVTSIRDVKEEPVSMEDLRNALQYGFEEALKIFLVPEELSDIEKERVIHLSGEKYSNDEWNFSR